MKAMEDPVACGRDKAAGLLQFASTSTLEKTLKTPSVPELSLKCEPMMAYRRIPAYIGVLSVSAMACCIGLSARTRARVSLRRKAAGHAGTRRKGVSKRCHFRFYQEFKPVIPVGAVRPNLQPSRDHTFPVRPSLTNHASNSFRL